MSEKETGGPAFPVVDSHANGYEGMTLRDYFAAKAMQSIVLAIYSGNSEQTETLDVAFDAYSMADAMLEARK